MAYTNETIYNNLMTILRKEKEGKVFTEDQFNELLLQGSWEVANDEYDKFEKNQIVTDSLSQLKVVEEVPVVDGIMQLSSLSNDYWHVCYINYESGGKNIKIDIVTENQWNERLSSDLELPTTDFPISSRLADRFRYYPIQGTTTYVQLDNVLLNTGYDTLFDWINDGVNPNPVPYYWTKGAYELSEINTFPAYGFNNKAWKLSETGGDSLSFTFRYSEPISIVAGTRYDVSFYYYIEFGYTSGVIIDILINDVAVISTTAVEDAKTLYNNYFTANTTNPASTFKIRIRDDDVDYDTFAIIDEVALIPTAPSYSHLVNFDYLKKPETPYFDYYYDANDQIVYLPEGTSYTLNTGETYIDKDDGTERSSGYTITSTENKTKELFLPEGERHKVLYNILQKMGVSLNEQDALQYGMIEEQKENNR